MLVARGYPEAAMRLILGRNMLRLAPTGLAAGAPRALAAVPWGEGAQASTSEATDNGRLAPAPALVLCRRP